MSTKNKICESLVKICSDEASSIGSVYVATQAQVRTDKPARLTKPQPETVTPKKHGNTKVATDQAIKSLPYPVEEEEQLIHTTTQQSWFIGDDLKWQRVPSPPGEAISPLSTQSKLGAGSMVSPLDTLPSQQSKLLLRPDENIVRSERARRSPLHRSIQSEVGGSHLGGQNGWKINSSTAPLKKPLQEQVVLPVKNCRAEAENNTQLEGKEPLHRKPLPVSAANLWMGATTTVDTSDHRRSRADEQAAELFLDGNFTNTEETKDEAKLSTSRILQADRRVDIPAKEIKAQSMPSMLRPGRRDNTYKAQSAGQVPVNYGTTLPRSENRKARLTTKEEEDWSQYLKWAGIGPSSQPSQTQDGRTELAENTIVKNSNYRETQLTAKEEERWEQYLAWSGISERDNAKDNWAEYLKWARIELSSPHSKAQNERAEHSSPRVAELEALPQTVHTPTHELEKMRSKEEIRMSFRLSNPGMHDIYATGGAVPTLAKSELSTASAPINNKEIGSTLGKKEVSLYLKQPRGQVPTRRLQDLRHTPPCWSEPQSAWDKIVVKVVASIESFSS